MYNNYFLFKQQIEEISGDIVNSNILDIFTFRKDEIIFELQTTTANVKYLCIGINSANPYILLKSFLPKHKSQIELFPFLIEKTIFKIFIIPFDKIIYFNIDDYTANAIFFGKGANLYIKNRSGVTIDSFKKIDHEPPLFDKEQYDFTTINKSDLTELVDKNKAYTIGEFLQVHFGAMNNTLINEICNRILLKKTENFELLLSQKIDKLYLAFSEIAEEMTREMFYLYKKDDNLLKINLFKPFFIKKDDSLYWEEYTSLNKVWDIFIDKQTVQKANNQTRKICLTALNKHKNYLERVLKQIDQNKDIVKKHELAVLKGNLLLTNKFKIKPHLSKVELQNIYSAELETIEIKLNPKKTLVENANLYFKKYKDIDFIREKWIIRENTVKAELKEIISLEKMLSVSTNSQKLNSIKESLIAMHLLQNGDRKNAQVHNLLKYSFNHQVLENEWEIFIGKNGKNNDLLSFSFAHNWDIWLHAQGVPGSHVIIRVPNKNTNPPQKIIDKAAQITAYHSKAQHSNIVPVIYTYVKYVHRIRKADPGTVNVQNEKVIFVKPLNLK